MSLTMHLFAEEYEHLTEKDLQDKYSQCKEQVISQFY